MNKKKSIGNREMMILDIIWDNEELSVRDVFKKISLEEEIAYTSIMSTMQNMEKKGLLIHREEGRAFIYSSCVKKGEVQGVLVKDLIDTAFKGSYENLIASLFNQKNISAQEIKDIAEKYISKKED